jgi:uncharacterized membrane protein
LFLALGTIYGLARDHLILVQFTLLCYVAAGLVLLLSSSAKWKGAVLQVVPALVALICYCNEEI